MGWIHPTSWALYKTIECLQSLNSKKGPPFILSHIFSSLPLVRGALHLACASFYFSVPRIYVETYVYDDVYVRLLMTSYLRQNSHHVR